MFHITNIMVKIFDIPEKYSWRCFDFQYFAVIYTLTFWNVDFSRVVASDFQILVTEISPRIDTLSRIAFRRHKTVFRRY